MNIVYKIFKCGEGYYVYDRNYNTIITISEEEYNSLSGENNDKQKKEKVLSFFQNKGFLKESRLKVIEHPATYILDVFKNRHIQQLILQVTQDCNLRCSYCFYVNEKYLGRRFSQKNMDFEIAKNAIDYFLKHSIASNEVVVSFYGGEPLLRMDLIKRCVDYISGKIENKSVSYALTTNGTLLNEENARYFYENNFDIMISLDGSKENHDKNRVFSNGKGSFDKIMKNIKVIKEKLPEFFDRIHFNCVIAPNTNYKRVREYIETDVLLKDSKFMTSFMQDNYVSEEIEFDHNLLIDTYYGEFKVLLYFMGRIDSSDISILFEAEIVSFQRMVDSLELHAPMAEKNHHGGPCIAGVRRLFVDVRGDFYPCERVSEYSRLMKIGDINSGVDENKVNALINFGKISKEKCIRCWAFNHCRICSADVDDLENFNTNMKNKRCEHTRKQILDDMMNICMVKQLKRKNRDIIIKKEISIERRI